MEIKLSILTLTGPSPNPRPLNAAFYVLYTAPCLMLLVCLYLLNLYESDALKLSPPPHVWPPSIHESHNVLTAYLDSGLCSWHGADFTLSSSKQRNIVACLLSVSVTQQRQQQQQHHARILFTCTRSHSSQCTCYGNGRSTHRRTS